MLNRRVNRQAFRQVRQLQCVNLAVDQMTTFDFAERKASAPGTQSIGRKERVGGGVTDRPAPPQPPRYFLLVSK